MLQTNVLVISDDPSLIEPISGIVRSVGGLAFESLPDLASIPTDSPWDRVALVVIHLRRPGPNSEIVPLLRSISSARKAVATILVADEPDPEQGPNLLRLGVADYLGRPLDLVKFARLTDILTARFRGPSPVLAKVPDPSPVALEVGEDEDPVMDVVRRVASQSATILLGGETGTGKTRLARRIHDFSNRKAEPFLVVDCGAMSSGPLESELFGQVRGSLDHYRKDRPGKIAQLGRGTLFLDDVDALPPTLQLRLLRAVEDQEFERGTSLKERPIRARLIAASNRDLEHEVDAGHFRSDLYYRLNVIGIELPPLRDRRPLIPILASRFLAASAVHTGRRVESISDEAMLALEDYNWPGNVRELKNTIERAVAVAPGETIRPDDLPEAVNRRDLATLKRTLFRPPASPVPTGPNSTLAEIKRDAELARITEALEKHSNNRLRAASELGISRMTLYKKLYKYGLMHPSPAERRAGP